MTLLVGTNTGLYRIDGDAVRLADGPVAALCTDGPTVWAVVHDTQLWQGEARGGFRLVTAAPMALRSLAVSGRELFVGTAGARLLRLDHDHFDEVGGFREVDGREDWHTPWGGPPDTRSLAAAPDGTLYANVHVGGVPRSDDEGDSWEPTIDIDADVHQVVVAAGGTVLCATAGGLATSEDRGTTWSWRTDGLPAHYARAVAVADDTVLLTVSDGPGGGNAAICRAPLDPAAPFVRCDLPALSGNVDTHCLVADGRAVTAADGGTLYASADAGERWAVLAEGLGEVRCLAVA